MEKIKIIITICSRQFAVGGSMKTLFVSSTFRDMQYERDVLRDIVMPRLNQKAHVYGEQLDFCDLRWGVTTQDMDGDKAATKVLQVCFNEIDRSDSPMIILLGYRYGWIPAKRIVGATVKKLAWDLEDLEKSVTALEIEYASFFKNKKVFIYIRNILGSEIPNIYFSESPKHKEKLDDLKMRLSKLSHGRLAYYTLNFKDGKPVREDLIQFAEQVISDLETAILPKWNRLDFLSPLEKERVKQWNFIENKSQMFLARQRDLETCLRMIKDSNEQTLICKGEIGSGKSTLFSRLALACREEGLTVLPFISGQTEWSKNILDILKGIVLFLEEELFGKQTEDGIEKYRFLGREELQLKLIEYSYQYGSLGKKMLIMIDAIDQLQADENREELIIIPEGVSTSIRYFFTLNYDMELKKKSSYILLPLSKEDQKLVIQGICQKMSKELADPVVEKILEKKSENPLYISLLVQRLLMMDVEDYDQINQGNIQEKDNLNQVQTTAEELLISVLKQRIKKINRESGELKKQAYQIAESKKQAYERNQSMGRTYDTEVAIAKRQMAIIRDCSNRVETLSVELLEEVGRRSNPNLVKFITEAIAVSRYGLRVEDFRKLCGASWDTLEFSCLIYYIRDFFQIRKDGRYDFQHKCFRAGILENMSKNLDRFDNLQGDNAPKLVHRQILEHLRQLEEQDTIRKEEIIYHCIKAEDERFFTEYVKRMGGNAGYHDFKACYEVCLEDQGKWMSKYLISVEGEDFSYEYMLFIVTLLDFFKETKGDFIALLRILQSFEESVKTLRNHVPTQTKRLILIQIYIYFIRCYQGLKDDVNAFEIGEKLREISIQEYGTKNDDLSRKSLFNMYFHSIQAMKSIEDKEKLRRAIKIGMEGLAVIYGGAKNLYEFEDALGSYVECMGEIYGRLGEHDNCLEAYEKALEIKKRIYEKYPSEGNATELSFGYYNVAVSLIESEKLEDRARAYREIEEAIRLLEVEGKIVEEYGDNLTQNRKQGLDAARMYKAAIIIGTIYLRDNFSEKVNVNIFQWFEKGLKYIMDVYHRSRLEADEYELEVFMKSISDHLIFRTSKDLREYTKGLRYWLHQELFCFLEKRDEKTLFSYLRFLNFVTKILVNSDFDNVHLYIFQVVGGVFTELNAISLTEEEKNLIVNYSQESIEICNEYLSHPQKIDEKLVGEYLCKVCSFFEKASEEENREAMECMTDIYARIADYYEQSTVVSSLEKALKWRKLTTFFRRMLLHEEASFYHLVSLAIEYCLIGIMELNVNKDLKQAREYKELAVNLHRKAKLWKEANTYDNQEQVEYYFGVLNLKIDELIHAVGS